MIRTVTLVAALVTATVPLSAQNERIDAPWRLSYFPYLTVSPNDGLSGVARVLYFQQADWGGRLSLQRSVAVEAAYSTRDAWLARVTWAEPLLADGWRFLAHGEIGSQPRFGNPDDGVERNRSELRLEVTRRLSGPLHLATRGAVQHDGLALTSAQHDRLYPGVPGSGPPMPEGSGMPVEISQTAVSGRAALVLDLRDREFDINSGLLAELGGFLGNASGLSDGSFSGMYGHIRGWLTPMERTRLSARVAFRSLPQTGAVAPRHEIPQWEMPFVTTGGPNAQRGLAVGEYPGRSLLLAGMEARHDVLNVGELGAVTLLAFVDGARVFNDTPECIEGPDCMGDREAAVGGDLQLTLKGWEWSPGGGVALRVLRAATLNITAAGSPHGTRWYVSSGWSW